MRKVKFRREVQKIEKYPEKNLEFFKKKRVLKFLKITKVDYLQTPRLVNTIVLIHF